MDFVYFLTGVIITVMVSAFFYIEAGKDLKEEAARLREEAEKLRRLQQLAIVVITDPKANYRPIYDAARNIVGLNLPLAANSIVMAKGKLGPPD